MKGLRSLGLVEKVYCGLLLAVFGGIVLHAPFTVFFGTLVPDHDLLIKAWKEILLVIAGVLLLVILGKEHKWALLKDRIILLIGAYGLVHIFLVPFRYQGIDEVIAGLMIDLRYVFFFALVYLAVKLYPRLFGPFIKIGIIGAAIVAVFGILQFTVLPNDILKHIGYGDSTISPYLTIDENPDYVRINSTLRGPNSVGAYAVIILAFIIALLASKKLSKSPRIQVLAAVLANGGIVILWASYSRSAAIAAAVAIAIVLLVRYRRKISRNVWIGGFVIAGALVGGLILAKDTPFVTNVILHENPVGGSAVSSNDGHASSLIEGLDRMVAQPLGGGIGSTGSASLLGDDPIIIENQYLFIAHEVGWVGLALFIAIFAVVIFRLWQGRGDWIALAVLASGVGIAAMAVLLPIWADDTIAIVWWGLAAATLARKKDKA